MALNRVQMYEVLHIMPGIIQPIDIPPVMSAVLGIDEDPITVLFGIHLIWEIGVVRGIPALV